ncbi:phosphotransferase family protein [Frankia sp. R43]|uniref:phosphotransferase family protein n=1 Tax=Frankia sp. R43 TaxID=269536 RepID=UPI000ACFA9ED|nr:phosphotransferase family protein [Frankia sp. R43]
MAVDDLAGSRPVRDEDALDIPAVDDWLRQYLRKQTDPETAGAAVPAAVAEGLGTQAGYEAASEVQTVPPAGRPEVRQFSGGASNLTYLLRYQDRDLVLRRPPQGRKATGAHDMAREFRVQTRLRPAFRYVPRMVAFCDDPTVIGSDFYVMEKVPGVIPRSEFPRSLTLDPVRTRQLAFKVVDLLVELHDIDPAAHGLSDLGRGVGYVDRQIRGWTRRYRDARTPNVPSYEAIMSWLAEYAPEDVASCLIHNDFRLDNVVFDVSHPTADGLPRISGVLDWEMATIGDPLMDLGGALAYWVQADDDEIYRLTRRQPSHSPGMPTRAEIVEYYGARRGVDIGRWPFYQVFGLFRLAVIAQQIYFRYHHGQTTNPAFRDYWKMVCHLETRCLQVMAAAGL